MRRLIQISCCFVLAGLPVVRTMDAAPARAPVAALEALTWDAKPGVLTVYVRTAAPVPPFVCHLSQDGVAEVSVEFPGVTHRLEPRYDIDSALVREIAVEDGLDNGPGTRIRFRLHAASLAALEQVSHGLVLRLEEAAATVPASSWSSLQDYRVGPGDKLEIGVFGHEDLNKIVEVRGDGSINYPLLGDLPVAGKTASEIDEEVTRLLGKDFLVDPQISVDVREYQSQWVTVMGEVRTPGRYILKRNMRLIDLLAEAGGSTKEAGREIRITRRADAQGGTRVITVSREKLLTLNDPEANLVLAHGDIVAVAEQELFYIRGEVQKAGPYYLADGMTILRAISVAGGLSPFANRKEIELLRPGARGVNKKMIVNLKAIEDGRKEDIPLLPNDTVIVPRRIF